MQADHNQFSLIEFLEQINSAVYAHLNDEWIKIQAIWLDAQMQSTNFGM